MKFLYLLFFLTLMSYPGSKVLAPVVQRMDKAVHRINYYPVMLLLLLLLLLLTLIHFIAQCYLSGG